MKIKLVLATLLITSVAIGQSTEELDSKGGFKEFKIGDSLSVHQSKITFTKTLDNADTKLYLVKDRVSVRNYTGEVELEFYKGRIQEIIVSFKNSSKTDFEDIHKSLETLYGPYQKSKEKSPAVTRFEKLYDWTGKKVKLRLGYDENYKLTEMVYIGVDDLAKLKEEF